MQLGTGFSKTKFDYVTDEKEVAADFVLFLQNFMKAYPKYQGRDVITSGESYAGHYVMA